MYCLLWNDAYYIAKVNIFCILINEKDIYSHNSRVIHLIEVSRRATMVLPNGTHFQIKNVLYSPQAKRNFLSFKNLLSVDII